MIEEYLNCLIFFVVLSILLIGIIEQYIFGKLSSAVYGWLTDEVSDLRRSDVFKEDDEEYKNFDKIQAKKQRLGIITKCVGYFEFELFSILPFLLLTHSQGGDLKSFMQLLPIAGGWIALKIFGNYEQWSGAVFGRSYFYVFLLESILNIGIALAIGWSLFNLIFR